MTWHLPLATMERLDTSTARLIAGTLGHVDRGERDEVRGDCGDMVLDVEQWRAKYGTERRAAA